MEVIRESLYMSLWNQRGFLLDSAHFGCTVLLTGRSWSDSHVAGTTHGGKLDVLNSLLSSHGKHHIVLLMALHDLHQYQSLYSNYHKRYILVIIALIFLPLTQKMILSYVKEVVHVCSHTLTSITLLLKRPFCEEQDRWKLRSLKAVSFSWT